MTDIVCVSDIVEANGRTIRENNLAKRHAIPVGQLVEVKYDTWFGGGACEKVHARLFVVGHDRDCDGTPLYSLGIRHGESGRTNGFAEGSLIPVTVDSKLLEGHGALEWDEDS